MQRPKLIVITKLKLAQCKHVRTKNDKFRATALQTRASRGNKAIDSRSEPLTNEQREDVDQGVFVLSAYESLKSQLSEMLGHRAQIQYSIVQHYLANTTGADSLQLYLDMQPDLWAQNFLVIYLLANADTLGASAILQSVNINNLPASQQDEWSGLCTYYGIRKQMLAAGIAAPDSVQVLALTELSASNTLTGVYARNALIQEDKLTYNEPYIFPDDNLKFGRVIAPKQKLGNYENTLKVYPNPAKDYIVAEYHMKEGSDIPTINIVDASGRTLIRTALVATSGYKVIPCYKLAPGSYTCTLYSGGKLLEVAKFIVTQ